MATGGPKSSRLKSKKVIAKDDLPALVLRIEEDVRYVIRAGVEY